MTINDAYTARSDIEERLDKFLRDLAATELIYRFIRTDVFAEVEALGGLDKSLLEERASWVA